MARNRGGQHQRRLALGVMGPLATSILIRGLSLESTDWPVYLHESGSRSTPLSKWTNIRPHGPCRTEPVTLPINNPSRGFLQHSRFTVYVFISASAPLVASLFCFTLSFLLFSQLESQVSLFLSFWSLLFYGPHDLSLFSLYTHTFPIQECRKKEEDERQALQAMRKEIEGLTSRCATLQVDLGENERQAKSQRDQKDSAQLKVKVWTKENMSIM